MFKNLENGERERQRKRENRRQANEAQREKERQRARTRDKTKEILLLEEKHEQFVAVRKWEILAGTKVKMSSSGKKVNKGRDPFNQTFRKFRSKTQWIGSVQPEKFRKNGSTF